MNAAGKQVIEGASVVIFIKHIFSEQVDAVTLTAHTDSQIDNFKVRYEP